MQVVVAGLDEACCRSLIGALGLHGNPLTWLDFEVFFDALDKQRWDLATTCAVWCFRSPAAVAIGAARCDEGDVATALDRWWVQNHAILNLHRQRGMPVRLVNVDDIAAVDKVAVGHGSINVDPATMDDPLRSLPELLGCVFGQAAPRYIQLYEALNASSWQPSGWRHSAPGFDRLADPEKFAPMLDAALSRIGMQSRLTVLDETVEQRDTELAQARVEAVEILRENELLLLQVDHAQNELRQHAISNEELASLLAARNSQLERLNLQVDRLKWQVKASQAQLRLRLDAIRRQPPGGIFRRWVQRAGRKEDKQSLHDEVLSQIMDIRNSRWFDADWYLKANDDVRLAGVDPAQHYYDVGWLQRRNPCAAFDTAYYLARYADVAASGLNPLWHFITHGEAEGRVCHAK